MAVTLRRLTERYAIAQLSKDAPIPAWFDGPGFSSFSRTGDEVSIVCPQDRVPADVRSDPGWCCFALAAPFAFDETGIALSVIRPLSEAGLGIFLISTFNGDMLLVKEADRNEAERLLAGAGHRFA